MRRALARLLGFEGGSTESDAKGVCCSERLRRNLRLALWLVAGSAPVLREGVLYCLGPNPLYHRDDKVDSRLSTKNSLSEGKEPFDWPNVVEDLSEKIRNWNAQKTKAYSAETQPETQEKEPGAGCGVCGVRCGVWGLGLVKGWGLAHPFGLKLGTRFRR